MPSANISCKLKKPKGYGGGLSVYAENLGGCCGISEITWQETICSLIRLDPYMSYTYSDIEDQRKKAAEITENQVRQMIRSALRNLDDERVVITGIPNDIRKGRDSDYYAYMPVYEKLIKLLPEFGFKQVGKPYKNKNSGNTIVVFIGKNGA